MCMHTSTDDNNPTRDTEKAGAAGKGEGVHHKLERDGSAPRKAFDCLGLVLLEPFYSHNGEAATS